ncbi:MAG TPA: lipase maturation factor family protein [Actinomycetes bacterium]|nr:lipase maturation factor family protein [Actinomycetes bacterium]
MSRLLLQRGLAAVYLVAFLVTANQFRPLLGERGLQPAPRFLAAVPFGRAPSIFHLHYSDRFLAGVAWTGAGLAAAALLGLPEAGPAWVSLAVWLAMWALYLSIVNVGQTFYGFGWETLLLEAGFLAIFLGPAATEPPTLVLWLYRWLLFRVEFGAGLIKLRGDRCWRDLTCLDYHHETQPLPGPLSWFFHHLPRPLHRAEVLANHATHLVVPFFLFAPQPVATVAGLAVIVTQAWLMVSGNFSWLNLITIVLAAAALDGRFLAAVLPFDPPATLAAPAGWQQAAVVALTLVVAALSVRPARNLLGRRQLMNASFDPLRLVNTYGAFGAITRVRREVILEGTDDPTPGPDTVWREYQFKAKPGDPRRRPRQVAPYHLRLDWLLWFAAMSPPSAHPWMVTLITRLLEHDPATVALLGPDPFGDRPPALVRARLYRYRFTTPAERRRTGAWWSRELVGEYLPPLRLDPVSGAPARRPGRPGTGRRR